MARAKGRLAVVSGTSNPKLAREVAEHLNVGLEDVQISTFADGEIYTRFNRSVRGAHVFVLQALCQPVNNNLVQVLTMVDALKRASAAEINVILPYYGYARQDRKATAREPISAKLVADLLTVAGATRVISFDLHAAQIQGFFDIPFDHLTASTLFIDHFEQKNLTADLAVAAPDVGRVKLSEKFANRLGAGLVILYKSRQGQDVQRMILVGDVAGKSVLIVDDMVDTGGTLAAAVETLKESGAQAVYACATHPVLSKDAVQTLDASPIEEMVFANTIPIPEQKILAKFRVLSVAPLLSKTIKNIYDDKPVGDLFEQV